jgi:hypothetical protein
MSAKSGILRGVFKIAIEAGARYDNPALAATWVKEHTKKQSSCLNPISLKNSSRRLEIHFAKFC